MKIKKLIVPIYSMRSYQDNRYSILKDGNLKLHLNRMDLENDLLVIPENCSDFDEFIDLDLVPEKHIIKMKYGINAVDTRKKFWDYNQDFIEEIDLEMITDITGYDGSLEFSNNFNITKIPALKRDYIDDFFDLDIQSIRKAKITTVLNHCQKDYIVKLYPELEDKVEVNQKVISKKYFDIVGIEEYSQEIRSDHIFFPFRLSDPVYDFAGMIDKYKNDVVIITDPNESYMNEFDNVVTIKPTKRQYYGILSKRPVIPYNEDPNKVFHPGLMDFIYFGCDIRCPYQLPTLEDGLI